MVRSFHYRKHERVIQISDTLIQLISGNLYSLYCKSQSYFQLEKYQEALKGCDEAVKLEKYYHKSTILKGHILLTLGKFEESVKCYSTAIDHYLQLENEKKLYLDGKLICAGTYLYRAIARDLLGMKTVAVSEYKIVILHLIEVESALPSYEINFLYFLKAITYSKLGKFKEANECYDKIQSREPYLKFYYDQEFFLSFIMIY